MTGYTQLAQVERYQIQALSGLEFTITDIADELGRHKSTISRELRRNKPSGNYSAIAAHRLALDRRQDKSQPRITALAWALARHKLRKDWSPEQVSLWLLAFKGLRISHTWIYQQVSIDKIHGGDLWKHLRHRKKRRKKYGSQDKRGQIKDRVSIDERPQAVEYRSRIGDWEIDTIIGAKRSGALLSLTERRSLGVLLAKLPACSAEEVINATIGLLSDLWNKVLTITADNGKEFSGHVEIARVLGTDFYFAHPYSPWERGTNENANGLVRQYFPKGRDFSTITQAELDLVMERLNHRPRKSLGMLTPHQVLCGIKHGVALAS